MGDRANIVVTNGDNDRVSLYSHWGGHRMPETLRAALVRGKERWTDPSYLARIIFCEMIKGDLDGLTGYGISQQSTHADAEQNLEVDVVAQTVRIKSRAPIPIAEYVRVPQTWPGDEEGRCG